MPPIRTRNALGELDVNLLRHTAQITKPGPKAMPFSHQNNENYQLPPRVRRSQRSFSRERKIQVLNYLKYHQIPITPGQRQMPLLDGQLPCQTPQKRRPMLIEAVSHFGIPQSTIQRWWKARDAICSQPKGTRSDKRFVRIEQYPEMEQLLILQLVLRRETHYAVTRRWVYKTAMRIHKELVGNVESDFIPTNGWFQRFCGRYGISLRKTTHEAQKVPEGYREVILKFLEFIRRHNSAIISGLPLTFPRYRLSRILNMDEVPIPFEFLEGFTYDLTGAKTIALKTEQSGWSKRQASLILTVFADGIKRVSPIIIFKAKTDNLLKAEGHLYHKDIIAKFNETAYNNGSLMIDWLNSVTQAINFEPALLIMDCAAFHLTPSFKQLLRDRRILAAIVPSGCTSLVQPLDVSFNKPFKAEMRERLDELLNEREEANKPTVKVSERRVLITQVVAHAWNLLHQHKQHIIVNSFRHTGIALSPDGHEDSEIRIKDFPECNLQKYIANLLPPS